VFVVLIIVRNFGDGSLNFSRLVSVDVFEDVLEGLRPLMKVFEHFVGLFNLAAVLSDAVDSFQELGRVVGCITRIFVVFASTDYLSDEWILKDTVAECLVMHCLEDGVLVGPWQLEYLQYVKPQIFDLCRALVDQIEVVPDRD